MPDCVRCKGPVARRFNYFCRRCYKFTLMKLTITNDDFVNYLNSSFRTNFVFPPIWRFVEIHRFVQWYVPSLRPLAVLLENVFFLKRVLKIKKV